MKEVLFKIFDKFTQKVDTYYNNGSMWLIFTDEKKWVIELTKEGVLWYNFYFFQDCFKYLSLDVVENQHYITEWFEETIQNGVSLTNPNVCKSLSPVEDIIQNGIKETHEDVYDNKGRVDGVIRNGIKETIELPDKSGELNGYGEYYARQKNRTYPHTDIVNDVITDGIKETNWRKVDNHPTYLDHILIEK